MSIDIWKIRRTIYAKKPYCPPLEKRLTRGGPPHNDKKNTGGQHPEIPTPELRLRAPPPTDK